MALARTIPVGYSQRHGARSHFRVHFRNSPHGLRIGRLKFACSDLCSSNLWGKIRVCPGHRSNVRVVACSSAGTTFAAPAKEILKAIAVSCRRALSGSNMCPVLLRSAPAVGILLFAAYGLTPCMQRLRKTFLKKDRSWDKSQMKHVVESYIRPLLLWVGVISMTRALDPVTFASVTSQAIKERLVNFVRSLSTVLAFAVCTTNLTQEVQKFLEKPNSDKGRDLSIQFIGNAVCSSVWVAAVCLFMELLGFSTQKLITAGGFGTVLVTLAGREIFTNFLSSVMIHATRPFIENQWIQTKIEGQEVSGTVEHVGWWSPTVVRGDDREAVHIPNHKFTVSVVRNLSQKTHWRIKTHLAISHLDVSKLNLIIADMRKVLAKNPQVEHKRLHRRVFLDTVHPENQALLILISCFVKTPRFEEYLRVKECILLDLLRVISHHNARLATPIRSVQRVSSDDSQSNGRYEYERPLLLPGSSILSRSSEDKQGRSSPQVADPAPDVIVEQPQQQQEQEQQASRVSAAPNFDADHLVEVKGQPRKIFVQDHVEEQIVGSIMAGENKNQDKLVVGPTISLDHKVQEPTTNSSGREN